MPRKHTPASTSAITWSHDKARKLICERDDTGHACGGREFHVVQFNDGIHVVCKKCEAEHTLGEVMESAYTKVPR